MRIPRRLLLMGWMLSALEPPKLQARPLTSPYVDHFKIVSAILVQPESQMDLAEIKLTVDHLIDPTTDKTAVLKQLDQMAGEVTASFPPAASNLAKFKALRDYLYQPSPLSGRKPFRYNFQDDRNPNAKLLSVYLATRRGNCVSMPLLLVILGPKLGIPVTITTSLCEVPRRQRSAVRGRGHQRRCMG